MSRLRQFCLLLTILLSTSALLLAGESSTLNEFAHLGDGAMLALTFQVEKEEVKIVSSVTSRVVRTILEMLDDGDVGSIAVQFEDQSEEVQSQLQSVVHLISAS